MQQIRLSQGKIAVLDDDDFERLSHFRWFYRRERNFNIGYAVRHGRKTDPASTIYLHRDIMSPPPRHEVVFLSRDHLDCRKQNLQVITAEEAQHRRRHLTGKPCSRRVRQDPHTGTWHAHIYLPDGRLHFIGTFGFKEEAYEACQVALQRKNPELHPVTVVVDRGVAIMKKSNQKSPACSAGEKHPANWTPFRQPTIVVPPAAEIQGKKWSPATPRAARRHRPQLSKLPKHRGPIFAAPCKIRGNETRIARSDVVPICQDCALNVVPKSVAHTIVLNDTVGASEFDLELILGQIEFDYLDEVSRRLV